MIQDSLLKLTFNLKCFLEIPFMNEASPYTCVFPPAFIAVFDWILALVRAIFNAVLLGKLLDDLYMCAVEESRVALAQSVLADPNRPGIPLELELPSAAILYDSSLHFTLLPPLLTPGIQVPVPMLAALNLRMASTTNWPLSFPFPANC
jgi:hypothetical protein